MNDQKAVQKFLNEGGISEESFLAGCDHVRKELESKLAEVERKLGILARETVKAYQWRRAPDGTALVVAREALEKIDGKEKQ